MQVEKNPRWCCVCTQARTPDPGSTHTHTARTFLCILCQNRRGPSRPSKSSCQLSSYQLLGLLWCLLTGERKYFCLFERTFLGGSKGSRMSRNKTTKKENKII